jgi:DNA mismatch endonuclease (patch repair protein)
VDVFTVERRSALMARIQGKNTKPEISVRCIAYGLGYRYRLHRRDLPGTPDLTFSRLKKVIFVHGCFWHQHKGCRYAYKPKSNTAFWEQKFSTNHYRDTRVLRELRRLGWKVLVVWECETETPKMLVSKITRFLAG